MTKIDTVIIAASKTPHLISMTQQAIDTANRDRQYANVIVVETYFLKNNMSKLPHQYRDCQIIHLPQKQFNYNHVLNESMKYLKSDYICFCNNDLLFHEGWAKALLIAFIAMPEYMSLSPCDPELHLTQLKYTDGDFIYEGYEVREFLCGWCFCIHRSVYEAIGGFDEGVAFWYSDNLYADQIRKAGIKHALVMNSQVEHIKRGSFTLNTCKSCLRNSLTTGQKIKYDFVKKRYE